MNLEKFRREKLPQYIKVVAEQHKEDKYRKIFDNKLWKADMAKVNELKKAIKNIRKKYNNARTYGYLKETREMRDEVWRIKLKYSPCGG